MQRRCKGCGKARVLPRLTIDRALPDTDKTDLDAEKAIAIMLAKPSAIKRPILEAGSEKDGVLLAGFRPDTYLAALKP